MANWKPPTAKSAGWSPRGLGWRRAGASIQQFGQDFSAQLIAIKQWQAEEEAKKQAAEQKRIEKMQDMAWKYSEALREQKEHEQDILLEERKVAATESRDAIMEDWRNAQIKKIDADIAKIYSQLGDEGMPKDFAKTLKTGAGVKTAYANALHAYISQAATNGFVNKDWTWFDEIEEKLTDPQMYTYKEMQTDMLGFPVERTKAAADMSQISAMYYTIAAQSNAYREKPREFKKLETVKPPPVQVRDDEKYKKARAEAYRLLVQYKQTNDEKFRDKADEIMAPFNPTEDELTDLLKKAGLK